MGEADVSGYKADSCKTPVGEVEGDLVGGIEGEIRGDFDEKWLVSSTLGLGDGDCV